MIEDQVGRVELSIDDSVDETTEVHSTSLGVADSADVAFFESQLAAKPDPLGKDIISSADSLSNSLNDKKMEFESALKRASATADPNDVLAAARSLSEYSIQTSIVAKAAGKSSQAVDKVTNLQ